MNTSAYNYAFLSLIDRQIKVTLRLESKMEKWIKVRKTFQSQFKEYGRHAIIGFFKLSNDAKIENPNFNEYFNE